MPGGARALAPPGAAFAAIKQNTSHWSENLTDQKTTAKPTSVELTVKSTLVECRSVSIVHMTIH